METEKKAGCRTRNTTALHRSDKGTPIQPENRHPRDIITHLFGFCKRFSEDRLFCDGFFIRAESLLDFGHGFFFFFMTKESFFKFSD